LSGSRETNGRVSGENLEAQEAEFGWIERKRERQTDRQKGGKRESLGASCFELRAAKEVALAEAQISIDAAEFGEFDGG